MEHMGTHGNTWSQHETRACDHAMPMPTGNYGSIVEVVMRKAGTHRVSDTDPRSLVEFWKQIYDIDRCPDEIPLLKEKMVNFAHVYIST